MKLIKVNKIPTTADILAPLVKTLDKLKAVQFLRDEHIQANAAKIHTLTSQNKEHRMEIDEAQKVIEGLETTFGIK